MAKTKSQLIRLKCTECSEINYTTTRGTAVGSEKLNLQKFCKRCRAHQPHKEVKIK